MTFGTWCTIYLVGMYATHALIVWEHQRLGNWTGDLGVAIWCMMFWPLTLPAILMALIGELMKGKDQ